VVPHRPGSLDVAAALLWRLAPSRGLANRVDQTHRDLRTVRESLQGLHPPPLVDATPGRPSLSEIDPWPRLLGRTTAARLASTRRDLTMIVRTLQGKPQPWRIARPHRPRSAPGGGDVVLLPRPTTTPWRSLRVTEIRHETSDATTLYLEDPGGAQLTYHAGQFLTVEVVVDGEPLRRAYSLSTAPREGRAAITVKAIEGGRVSTRLVHAIAVGDTLRCLGPSGHFGYRPAATPAPRVVLVAGGSGITPIRAILRSLLDHPVRPRIQMIYGSRSFDAIIFREDLEATVRAHPQVTLTHVLEAPPPGWTGPTGWVAAEHLAACFEDRSACHWFVCGPEPMRHAVRAALRARGIPDAQVFEEIYVRPERAPAPTQCTPARTLPVLVRRPDQERTVVSVPGQTLLEAGLAGGLPMPFSCTVGGCAACKVVLEAGEVASDEPNCLTPEERAAGYVLACVSRALSPCTIRIDSEEPR
jgi:ferredoxin-NADP reductase